MHDNYSAVLGLALRQFWRVENLALAVLQFFATAAIFGLTLLLLTSQISITGRPELDLALLPMPIGLVVAVPMMALLSRVNGVALGRPFPVSALRALWRYIRAIFVLTLFAILVMLPAITLAAFIGAQVGGEELSPLLMLVPAIISVFLIYWLFFRYLLLPVTVIYEGRISFSRARKLIQGRRWRAFGVLLTLFVPAFIVNTGASALAQALPDMMWITVIAAPIGALFLGPMTVAVTTFYFTGLERLDVPAGV